MKRFIMILIPVLLIAAFLGGCRMEHEEEIDALLAEFSGDIPGAAVMVVHNGKPVFAKGYGLAVLEKKAPVTPKTNLRLASVTKQFTAMCIMQLVEAEKLSLNSTLPDIFPDFPSYGQTVTVKNLLQHTSGLISYESLIPDDAVEQVHDDDVLAMMATQDSTYFPPGAFYRYSNSGYAVLAMIVENVSGMTFPEYLRENIFSPLGMDNSIAFVEGISTVPNRSYGYAKEGEEFAFSDQSLTSAVLGDGGIYTSIEDLYKWDQALYTEKLVSASLLGQAFTSGRLLDGSLTDYGFGWEVGSLEGYRRVMHMGGTCGFSTTLQRYIDEKLTVIILSNRRGADIKGTGETIALMFLNE